MLIQREIHVGAPMRAVAAECEACPCPSALSVIPEGAGTRVRVHAEVTPDDLAEFVEIQLVDMLRSIRHRVATRDARTSPTQLPAPHQSTNQEPNQ